MDQATKDQLASFIEKSAQIHEQTGDVLKTLEQRITRLENENERLWKIIDRQIECIKILGKNNGATIL